MPSGTLISLSGNPKGPAAPNAKTGTYNVLETARKKSVQTRSTSMGNGSSLVAPSGTNTSLDLNNMNWDPQTGAFYWGKVADSKVVTLFGDQNGNPLVLKSDEGPMPLDFENAKADIIRTFSAKKGGISDLKHRLLKAGFIPASSAAAAEINSDTISSQVFNAALNNALIQGSDENLALVKIGAKKINSFTDWLRRAKANPIFSGDNSGSPSRSVRIQTQKFKPEEFDIPIDQMFQQTIGRGATADELLEFTNMLNKYSAANPEKAVSVTSGTTTRTTVSGGVGPDVIAAKMRDKAMANPDAEEYNKATKYLDYFKQAIAAPVQLG